MNDFEPKRERALEILAATGMWRSSYAPPIYRLLWRRGWELRPPHFASVGVNFAFCSGFFALGLTLLKLALPWGRDMTIGEVFFAGIAFGCSMALYYRHRTALLLAPALGAASSRSIRGSNG
jgi:asparagine N-glycosylation enzyme membrane subunit Stt3